MDKRKPAVDRLELAEFYMEAGLHELKKCIAVSLIVSG
jgi:hypothetical protein